MPRRKSTKDMVNTPEPPKRGRGAPKGSGSYYHPHIVDEIIDRLIEGETLVRITRFDRGGIAREPNTFPGLRIIYDWAEPGDAQCKPEFVSAYARARLGQQRTWLEECSDISNETMSTEELVIEERDKLGATTKMSRRSQKDNVARSQLRIQTRLNVIARMNPQLWAERLQQADRGYADDGAPGGSHVVIEGGLPDSVISDDADETS